VDGVAGTEIRGVSYAGGSLTAVGSTTVPGSVKDQYSLDEYAGLLRVVTTVRKAATKRVNGQGISDEIVSAETGGSSASLWLVNLTDWSLRAKVEEFAPIGETVQSVRFDRQYAYVCTAVTHQYLDPVFSFDLTDPDNIISRDSGTINGYSTSLIQLGGGYLLGIGYGDSRNDMKVEVWQVTDGAVTSVCSYLAQNTRFSEVYKSYYIDRENGLFGFVTYGGTVDYRLLRFDGYDLVTVARVDLYPSFDGSGANFGDCRATIVDGWLYTLIPGDFRVTEIGI